MGLGDRDDVVEIDGARSFHSVLLREEDFGWHAANGGSDGRHSNGGQVADGAVPGEHDDRPLLVGVREPVQADFSAPYLSLIHISEPTRLGMISYAVFCL